MLDNKIKNEYNTRTLAQTGQQGICEGAGAVCVAQDSRLTCLSVFDLSIRAQTLAMWPLTPALCEGHARGQMSSEFPEHRDSSTRAHFTNLSGDFSHQQQKHQPCWMNRYVWKVHFNVVPHASVSYCFCSIISTGSLFYHMHIKAACSASRGNRDVGYRRILTPAAETRATL